MTRKERFGTELISIGGFGLVCLEYLSDDLLTDLDEVRRALGESIFIKIVKIKKVGTDQ